MEFKDDMKFKENIICDNEVAIEMYSNAIELIKENDRSISFYRKYQNFCLKLERLHRQKIINNMQYNLILQII